MDLSAISKQKLRGRFEVSAFMLHVTAMLFMLCDHSWAMLFPSQRWLTCVGRIAFPIFAFMIVEGYFHTHNLKKYVLRMLIFALISEIPFDLMYAGIWFHPFHQNVLWTFLIAMAGIWLMEKAKQKGKLWLTILTDVLVVLVGIILGFATMVDYYGTGVLTVFVFYFFRKRKWWCYVGQLLVLYWLNVELLGGLVYPFEIFGHQFELVEQGLALLALIPIWLYRGKQGFHNKAFQYFCYAFYPVHCFILFLLTKILW